MVFYLTGTLSTKMEQEVISVSCIYCQGTYPMKSIVQHAVRSECKSKYTDIQLSNLRKHSTELSKAKKAKRYQHKKEEYSQYYLERKEKLALKYQENKLAIAKKYNKTERAKKYQDKKVEIAQTYQDKKDEIAQMYQDKKAEIAQKYQSNRVKIALNYSNKKADIAKKYDKKRRQEAYKKVMAKIAHEKERLKNNKKSEEGFEFSRLCDRIFNDIYYEIKDEYMNTAFIEIYDKDLDQDIMNANMDDDYYEANKDKWIRQVIRSTYDCEEINQIQGTSLPCKDLANKEPYPKSQCIHHMTDEERDEIFETSIKEVMEDEFEKKLKKKADDLVKQEYKLMFPSYEFLLFGEVAKRSCNKAFKSIFEQKYLDIYRRAYETAEEKYKTIKETRDEIIGLKIYFPDILAKELEASSGLVEEDCHEDIHRRAHKAAEEKYKLMKKAKDKARTSFHTILAKELEASEQLVQEDIAKIFKNDYLNSIEKEFEFFKGRIHYKMKDINTWRKNWATKKVKEVERTFEGIEMGKIIKLCLKLLNLELRKSSINMRLVLAMLMQ